MTGDELTRAMKRILLRVTHGHVTVRATSGAVVSVDFVESNLDIDITEKCSLFTNSRPSLLDSLKCPKPSECARKHEKLE